MRTQKRKEEGEISTPTEKRRFGKKKSGTNLGSETQRRRRNLHTHREETGGEEEIGNKSQINRPRRRRGEET
jgi:hypothetical protein